MMLARHQQEIQANRGSGIGSGEGPAEESPPAGRLTDETNYFLFLSTNRPMRADSGVVSAITILRQQ